MKFLYSAPMKPIPTPMIKRIFIIVFLFPALCFAFTEPPELTVSKPSGTIKYLDADGGGCSNGDTDYAVSTKSCGAGSSTVYTTLENADGNIGAGNTLRITAGTYNANTWNEDGSGIGSEVVIDAYNGESVVIQGTFDIQADYIIVDGGSNKTLDFRRVSGDTIIIRVRRNYTTLWRIKVTGPSGTCDSTNNSCIDLKNTTTDLYPANFKIYNCVLNLCSHKGIYVNDGQDGEIKNNIISNTGNNGLQINPHEGNTRVNNLEISGNAFYDNGDCVAMPGDNIYIQGTSSGEGLANVDIYNNLLWGSTQNAIDFGGNGYPDGAVNIYNNTMFSNGAYGIDIDSNVTDNVITIRNNIIWDNSSGSLTYSGVTITLDNNRCNSGCDNSGDPNFVSETVSNANYLKIQSSDNGYDTNPPVDNDYFGNGRPADNLDIGAHEYSVVAEDCDVVGDEDLNGFSDCLDAACNGETGPNGETCEYGTELTCDDGYDNNGNGDTDCDDADCLDDSACFRGLQGTVQLQGGTID